jgi:heterodisulfide reductase subunit B
MTCASDHTWLPFSLTKVCAKCGAAIITDAPSTEQLTQAIRDYANAVLNNEGVHFIEDIQNLTSRHIVMAIYEALQP